MGWKRTRLAVAVAALATIAAVAFAPAHEPPASIWFDGERSLPSGDDSLPGSVRIEPQFFVHCGMETRPRSASGVLVPGWGDPLAWTEPPPLHEQIFALLRTGKWATARVVRHHYHLSATRQDHRDDEGTWWFRYDLRSPAAPAK